MYDGSNALQKYIYVLFQSVFLISVFFVSVFYLVSSTPSISYKTCWHNFHSGGWVGSQLLLLAALVEGEAAAEEPEQDDPPPHPPHHCWSLRHPGILITTMFSLTLKLGTHARCHSRFGSYSMLCSFSWPYLVLTHVHHCSPSGGHSSWNCLDCHCLLVGRWTNL